MSHRIWVTSVFLTFVISNRDQKVSNVITTIIVIVPRPALNYLFSIFINERKSSQIRPLYLLKTYVRISPNSKWQQVAPSAHPIEIETNINIMMFNGNIFDTEYIFQCGREDFLTYFIKIETDILIWIAPTTCRCGSKNYSFEGWKSETRAKNTNLKYC